MRLNTYQRDVIRCATSELAGPMARVLVFGSRTDPELCGRDIGECAELRTRCSADISFLYPGLAQV